MVEYTCRYTILGYYWIITMVMQSYICQTAAEDEKILSLFSFTICIIIVPRRLYVPNIVT